MKHWRRCSALSPMTGSAPDPPDPGNEPNGPRAQRWHRSPGARLSASDRARAKALAAPLRAASTTAALIDRDAVWAARRSTLELIRAVTLTGEQPVLLEDLPAHAGVRAVAEAVSGGLRRQTPVA